MQVNPSDRGNFPDEFKAVIPKSNEKIFLEFFLVILHLLHSQCVAYRTLITFQFFTMHVVMRNYLKGLIQLCLSCIVERCTLFKQLHINVQNFIEMLKIEHTFFQTFSFPTRRKQLSFVNGFQIMQICDFSTRAFQLQ